MTVPELRNWVIGGDSGTVSLISDNDGHTLAEFPVATDVNQLIGVQAIACPAANVRHPARNQWSGCRHPATSDRQSRRAMR
jgi:hypothetical protein